MPALYLMGKRNKDISIDSRKINEKIRDWNAMSSKKKEKERKAKGSGG